MDCRDFKVWLVFRDGGDADISRAARAHRRDCPPCDRLYRADEGLEQTLAAGIQTTKVPDGMAQRARALASESIDAPRVRRSTWLRKGLTPALAFGLILVVMVWNPFTNPLSSLDAIGNYALANHTRRDMAMAFTVDETPDPQAWFFQRLNYRITLPDLQDRGLTLRGGRECSIGPHKAAYLFYDDNGKPVSVFIIPADKINMALQTDRRYRIDAPAHRVDLWQTNDMVCILVQGRPAALPAET